MSSDNPDYKSPSQTISTSNCNERNRFVHMCRKGILEYIPLISSFSLIIMAELLSIMKSDCGCCQAVTVTSISQALEDFSKPMTCRKTTDLVQTFAQSYTRQVM